MCRHLRPCRSSSTSTAACSDHGVSKLLTESTVLDRRRPMASCAVAVAAGCCEMETSSRLNALGTSKVWASHSAVDNLSQSSVGHLHAEGDRD